MNALFLIVTVISMCILMITSPDSVLGIMIDGGKGALDLALKMTAVYSVWLSILKIIEKTNLDKKITSLFEPVVNFIYKDENSTAKSFITMNMTANLLGMGGAATPMGIKAINSMNRGADPLKATTNMIMFFVINATSLQFIPATVIALRASSGSASPSDILLPNIIASVVSAGAGFLIVKIISVIEKKKEGRRLTGISAFKKQTKPPLFEFGKKR